ncbi:MAG: ABC transporter permease subunit [Chthoniobacterales bacterium]|nr:ABC transporter permease subunit [Chthoniobacterales bacterium]
MTNISKILSLVLLAGGIFFFLSLLCLKGESHLLDWKVVWRYRAVFWQGWLETIAISIMALLLSSFFGTVIVSLERSSVVLLRRSAFCFVELIRGTPLLVQILFFFYVVAHQCGLENRMVTGVIILSLFSSTYIAEIIRGGIEVIPLSLSGNRQRC